MRFYSCYCDRDDPFENHIQTLINFLSTLKLASNQEEKDKLSDQFMRFIVATSWRNMARRATHWSSSGFLYTLSQIPKEALKSVFTSTFASLVEDDNRLDSEDDASNEMCQRKDQALVKAIMKMTDQEVCDLTKGVPSVLEINDGNCELKNLRQAMQDAADAGHNALKFYTKKTYEEFHILLISALFKFRKSLKEFRNSSGQFKPRDPAHRETLRSQAKSIHVHGYLLWCIVYSKTCSRHMTVLGDFLRTPTSGMNEAARAWLDSPLASRDTKGVLGTLFSAFRRRSGSRSDSRWGSKNRTQRTAERTAESMGKEVNDDDVDIDQELEGLLAQAGDNKRVLFLNWSRQLVRHWQSLQNLIILRDNDHLAPDAVHWSLLNFPSTMVGSTTVEDWIEFVTTHLPTKLGRDKNSVIAWFKEKMTPGSISNASPEAKKATAPFPFGGSEEIRSWPHCESLLKTILKYGFKTEEGVTIIPKNSDAEV